MVGISEYVVLNKLPNAANDARAIAKLLKDAGATVIHVQDCHITALREAKDKFFNLLNEGDIAIFFFAGHGCQFRNQQRCLARGLTREEKLRMDKGVQLIKDSSINIDLLISRLVDEKKTRLNLILLDCCRNFKNEDTIRREGLDIIKPGDQKAFNLNVPVGTVIGYAAAASMEAHDPKLSSGRSLSNGKGHGMDLLLSTPH